MVNDLSLDPLTVMDIEWICAPRMPGQPGIALRFPRRSIPALTGA